jgi:two-component system nitrate/nitrite sensor histidine kinase NarX
LLGVSQSVLLITDMDDHWTVLKDNVLAPVAETLPSPAAVAAHDFAAKLGDSVLPQSQLFTAYPWAEAFLPLRNGDRLFGVLILGPPTPDGHYHNKQVAVLQQFANMLVVTVESILLYESARDMALELLSARDAERTNLALIIHDEPLQHLTLLAALVPDQLPQLHQGLSAVANQLREIMAGLHSPVLKQSLSRAILEVAEEFQARHQINVRVLSLVSDDLDIPLDIGNAFHQVLRESLHNVLKHADATTVEIALVHEHDELRMTVADDGRNGAIPDTASVHELIQGRHFGLVGMHQRVALLGGRWRLKPRANGGAIVIMSIPFQPKRQLAGAGFR